ncbi:hypothetical protein B0H14DRAFT_61355 [Mycena olivaceomarginata]|nr:hypothetical protein B0H14DRAFT_61355 [Mycena olivaceomarginata]
MDQDCPDFHLCTQCEEQNTHSQDHLFLRTSPSGYVPKANVHSAKALHPEVLWAQRSSQFDESKNVVYLTVNLADIEKLSFECALGPEKMAFKAECPTGSYYFEIDFFSKIIPEKSMRTLTARSLSMALCKKTHGAEYWPRLTAEIARNAHINGELRAALGDIEARGTRHRKRVHLDKPGRHVCRIRCVGGDHGFSTSLRPRRRTRLAAANAARRPSPKNSTRRAD